MLYHRDMQSHSPDLDEARRIIYKGLCGYRAKLFLFGSWAKGNAARTSDIDVALLAQDPVPPHVLADIREELEESRIVYPVDLVDLSHCSDSFRQRVLREGIPWDE